MAKIKHITDTELSTTGATINQTLIHNGTKFAPSSALSGLQSLIANRANVVHVDGSRTYYDTYALAQAAAVAGDTLIVPANIADLTGAGNDAQIGLWTNISLQSLGFQIGAIDAAADAITIYGNTGTSRGSLQGSNSVVLTNQITSSGAWGLGTYNWSNNLFYDFYELRFKTISTTSSSTMLFDSPNSTFNFFNCNIEHSANGRVISAYNNSAGVTLNFYNCNIKTFCTAGVANIEAINATSNINFYNCNFDISGLTNFNTNAGATMSFYGCNIYAKNRTITTQLMGNTTKIGNIKLVNTNVIANTTANFAIQCDTLTLEGNTTIVGAISANTITDTRPVSTVAAPYATIAALKSSNSLKLGTSYTITDFQTIHVIPNTMTAPSTKAIAVNGITYNDPSLWDSTKVLDGVEPLILMAVTTNSFSTTAYSQTYPTDIIYFDFNDILCEDGVTPRRGKITYRKDVIKGLETYYDWRTVRFRRWKANPVAWISTTAYSRGAVVLGSDGAVYASKKLGNNSNTGNDPITSAYAGNGASGEYAVIQSLYWTKLLVPSRTMYVSPSPVNFVAGFATVPALATDFQDSYTFNTSIAGSGGGAMRNISIGLAASYNNIIFTDTSVNVTNPPNSNAAGDGTGFNNNFFETGCTNMTFSVASVYGNNFGQLCTNNIIQGGFYYNKCGTGFANNLSVVIRPGYYSPISRNDFAASCTNNTFYPETQQNLMQGTFQQNACEYQFTGNEMRNTCYGCNFGSGWRSNKTEQINFSQFGVNCHYNNLQGGSFNNAGVNNVIVGDNFRYNTINSFSATAVGNSIVGNDVQQNVIYGVQSNINLPNGFQFNRISGVFAVGTTFAVNSNKNTFSNDFGGGTVAVPLLVTECVFNQAVVGLQVPSTSVILARVNFNCAITNKTILSTQTNNTITASPDGNLWASNTQNTTGTITNTLIT